VGLLLLAVVATPLAFWLFFTPKGPPAAPTPVKLARPLQPVLPEFSITDLFVGRELPPELLGRARVFSTVQQALRAARPGDRVVVLDPVLTEQVALEGEQLAKGVTLEGANPDNPVLWHTPVKTFDKNRPLLALANVEGFRLKGFILDGDDETAETLVSVTGRCPGLKLEKLHLKDFKRNAITLSSCAGESDQQISINHVRTTTGKRKFRTCALDFKVEPGKNPAAGTRHIVVSDCRFEGLYRSAVQLEGSVAFVEFRRNRFFIHDKAERREVVAFLYKNEEPIEQLHLTIANNTFLRFNTCLHLKRLPQAGADNGVQLNSNLFLSSTILVSGDESVTEAQLKPLFQGCVGNVSRAPQSPAEPSLVPIKPLEFESLSENFKDDNLFLRYPKASILFKAGPDNTPVGVPPPG